MKKNKTKKLSDDLRITGVRKVIQEDGEKSAYIHRSRAARRAEARLAGKEWRNLSEHERFTL